MCVCVNIRHFFYLLRHLVSRDGEEKTVGAREGVEREGGVEGGGGRHRLTEQASARTRERVRGVGGGGVEWSQKPIFVGTKRIQARTPNPPYPTTPTKK